MIECPNCQTVIPSGSDGICPACLPDTQTPPAVTTSTIPVRRRCSMPEICFDCGESSRRSARVVLTRPPTGLVHQWESLAFLTKLLWPLIGFLAIFVTLFVDLIRGMFRMTVRPASRRNLKVSLRIRQCRSCARKGPPYPRHVSYERNEMDFDVHPVFATHFAQSNLEYDAQTECWQT